MSENVGKLAKALASISKAVGSLAPDKRNKEQNYDYISADKILSSIGKEMAAAGVVVIPSVTDSESQTITYNSYGKEKNRIDARITLTMLIAHESGESTERPWIGYGTDYVTPDKAIYKAITSGHKYFLMKLFNVGIGNEDGEHEMYEEPESPPVTRQAPQQYQPRPQPAPAAPVQTNGKHPGPAVKPSFFMKGDEVMIKGKTDEKPGTVDADEVDGQLIAVKVDGKVINIGRDKLTLIPTQPTLIAASEPATNYSD